MKTFEEFSKTKRVKMYVNVADNYKYFNHKLSTNRFGYTETTRTVTLEKDPEGLFDVYGTIVIDSKKAIVAGDNDQVEIIGWAI